MQRVKHDDFVDAIEELGQQTRLEYIQHRLGDISFIASLSGNPLNGLTANIAGHHDDRVLEIDCVPMVIGEPTVVEHLQQDIEYVLVCLFDFVQEDHTVRTTAYRFGQLSTFFIAHVARRRTDQTTDRVPFHEFAHVDPDHGVFVIEEDFRQCLTELRLANASRAKKDKRTDGPTGVLQPTATATNCVGHGRDRFRLPDNALMQAVLELEQFLPFGFHHARDRNTGPGTDDLGDFLFGDFLPQQASFGLRNIAAGITFLFGLNSLL